MARQKQVDCGVGTKLMSAVADEVLAVPADGSRLGPVAVRQVVKVLLLVRIIRAAGLDVVSSEGL